MGKIQVVSVDNCLNFYPRNLLREVFEFRHEMITRLEWSQGLCLQKTPMSGRYSEADDQDKPGTTYFVKQDENEDIVGVIRVSQSVDKTGKDISMIRQAFNDLVDPSIGMPSAQNVWETSRIVLDQEKHRTPAERKEIVNELICSTFFYAQQSGIKALFCFMAEGLWESTYKRIGFEVDRLGPNKIIEDKRTYNVYAGVMQINDKVMKRVSENTGLDSSILDFGYAPSNFQSALKPLPPISGSPQ